MHPSFRIPDLEELVEDEGNDMPGRLLPMLAPGVIRSHCSCLDHCPLPAIGPHYPLHVLLHGVRVDVGCYMGSMLDWWGAVLTADAVRDRVGGLPVHPALSLGNQQ